MKIRVRYKDKRDAIDVNATDTLKNVQDRIQHIAPTDTTWFISLNGKDEIKADADASLISLGIVGGDLIHVVEMMGKIGEAKDSLEGQLLDMGFTQSNIRKVLETFGAKSLNDALELLSMLDNTLDTNTTGKEDDRKREVNKTTEELNSVDNETIIYDLSSLNTNKSIGTEKNDISTVTHLKPLFLCDGITDVFTRVSGKVECKTTADYLFLAVHTLLLESGLRMYEPIEKLSGQFHETSINEAWKNSSAGFYRQNYTYKSHDQMKCCVTGTVTGNSMVVSVTLDSDDSDAVYQVKLNVSEHVEKNEIGSGKCEKIMKNLDRLSRKIKENVAFKLLDEIRKALGISESIVGIDALPEELKLRLISYLPTKGVCRMSQVSRDWKNLCADDVIWKRILFREFRSSNLQGSTYKEAVKMLYRIRKEEEERERRRNVARTPLRPDFTIPDDFPQSALPAVPGIIGGQHDLFPSAGGVLHPHRDILRQPPSNIRRPPGARFDPYGPIPDDDDFQHGRQQPHPDILHRPRFGRDFGGGFF